LAKVSQPCYTLAADNDAPLTDEWRVLVEMASVPSQLVGEVEPVLELADERGVG
jgi:hypothetical protein